MGRCAFSARLGRYLTIVVAAVTAAAAVGTGIAPDLPAAAARADVVTASQNNLRDGWDPSEPGLAPVSDGGPVGGPTFGKLFATQLNGQIYAQPIVAGQTVIVATETNHVYGLNAATGAVEWSDDLGPAEPSSVLNCGDLTPDIGVTSTPVYDPATGTVYLVAVVNDGPSSGQPHVYAYALGAQTGTIQPGWPVPIHGAAVNGPADQFNPLTERQRTGLLLMNGSIYMAFASYCDYQPFTGYVAGVNVTSRATTLWSDEAGVTDSEGGIWQGGGGLMSDGPGRLFLATGNGVSPAPGPGTSPPGALGDSVVRLGVASDGTLSAADFFSPANAPALDAGDVDFGSGGPVGLPFGTSAYPDLLVQAGKDGRVFLLNRDSLGGREQGAGGTDNAVAVAGPYQGQWGHPAVFGPTATVASGTSAAASGDYIYYVGRNDVMRYLELGATSSGTPILSNVATSSNTLGYTSGSPVVTSNGDDPASAVVWEVNAPSESGASASLDAYPAVPPASCATPCSVSPIWAAPIGTSAKFTIPATNAGRVYVGTRDGVLYGFGSPDAAPLAGSPLSFGSVATGKSATATGTFTATAAVTASGASAASPFKAGSPSVNGTATSWPVSLSIGDTLTVPVTFKPARPGGVTGDLQLATSAANFPTVTVSLTGTGTAPGYYATPGSLSFGSVPDGTSRSASVTITNGSTGPERVAQLTAPAVLFSVRLPAQGTVLAAGQSVTVPVRFSPQKPGSYSSWFKITAGNGHGVTVKLSGTGAKAVSRLTPATASVSFGNVALGQRAIKTIDITNNGNLPATVTSAGLPRVPFGAQAGIAAGLPVNPGYDVEVPVTFTPSSTGPATGSFTLQWRDALGPHTLTVPISGTGVAPSSGQAIAAPGGGWTLNGTASLTGTALNLVPSGRNRAGSAVYAMAETASGLKARFTARLGGQGGLTFSLLSAKTEGPAALGGAGGQAGFGGLHGVAVVLDAGKFAGQSSANFVGIATGAASGRLRFAATTTHVPNLRSGSHAIGVTVASGKISVTVDGTSVLSARPAAGTIPSPALAAFTGGSGQDGGSQQVTGTVISAGTVSLPAPGGGWSYNGSTQQDRSVVELTPAVANAAGSVVYPTAVPTSGLTVTFTAQLSGGTGADGLGFALLNPADGSATSLGGTGTGVGLSGLTGTGVLLTTNRGGACSWANAALLCAARGTAGLANLAAAQAVPPLRGGPHTVTVQVTQASGRYLVTAWVDGAQVLQQAAPGLTATSLLAFTGATSTKTDVHLIRDVAISAAAG
ncbi:MAG TPA: choice-of-anchor D domain-containing protein [Streptosporangiaceae bacterium]|nr:choice-of-anchor D domain-containing protein [Streptosporangiaceae bacterium]